jgi:hypothetical protein
MKHRIPTDEEIKKIGDDVLNWRYDCNLKLLKHLMAGYKQQSDHDEQTHHPKLSVFLLAMSFSFVVQINLMQKIWELCSPKMKKTAAN